MSLPLGLDLKSIVAGILLAWFVIPFVQSLFLRPTAARAAA
jgi:antibiotic biosynthesis monooxygenase (ABM) superfamily enzyme